MKNQFSYSRNIRSTFFLDNIFLQQKQQQYISILLLFNLKKSGVMAKIVGICSLPQKCSNSGNTIVTKTITNACM